MRLSAAELGLEVADADALTRNALQLLRPVRSPTSTRTGRRSSAWLRFRSTKIEFAKVSAYSR